MAGILEELTSIRTNLQDSLEIGVLVAYIKETSLQSVTAAIKTLYEERMK